jgi:hypothetical protein
MYFCAEALRAAGVAVGSDNLDCGNCLKVEISKGQR